VTLKKHPIQQLLESQSIRTFSYNGRSDGTTVRCLGAYCTLGGLLRAVSSASKYFIDTCDIEMFVTDIAGAITNSGRMFYWPNVRFIEENK
jgi:hypothetical protein